jgi:type III pantothenate kinase
MNLVVDVGNTKVKLAVFEDSNIVYKKSIEINSLKNEFDELTAKFNIDKGIISSVGKLTKEEITKYFKKITLLSLTSSTPIPFKNKYKTPETLGVDRIALVSACVKNYPNKNCLVIDSGTCITYDFIDNKNNYYGGAISPGINMRYKALHTFTANLPLLKKKEIEKITGNTSKRAIHSGVVKGTLFEIEGVVNRYQEKYEDLTVILTGGDAKFLSKQLKNSIFANSNFLLEGLNFILEINSNE